MLYSIGNWIYDLGTEPLTVTFQRLKRFGFDGVELIFEPGQYDVTEIRYLCAQHGLRALSILGWSIASMNSRDLAHPDQRTRQEAIAYIKQAVDFAAQVGASLVVVMAAPAGRSAPIGAVRTYEEWQAAAEAEWCNAVESVKALGAYAEPKQVSLAIEPLNRFESFLINNVEQGLRFAREVGSPAVRLNLDTFHMNIEEPDLVDAIHRAGSLVANVHISDSSHGPVGSGHTDFRAIVRALKDIGYAGALTLEPTPPHPNGFLTVRAQAFLPLRDAYAEQCITQLRKYEAEVAA